MSLAEMDDGELAREGGVKGRLLFGDHTKSGVTARWHDFICIRPVDRSTSFRASTMEICVNFTGNGTVLSRSQPWQVMPQTIAHYVTRRTNGSCLRAAEERHMFLAIEVTRTWLKGVIGENADDASRPIQRFLARERCLEVLHTPMPPAMRRLSEEIVNPPLDGSGALLWYQGKILEVVAHAAFAPEKELFCQRHKRLARERVEAVRSALARDLEHPPSLTALGRECGCSPCYLSRIFSEETGMTISRYLRNLRLEAAADLLRTGRHNVTEAAMIVGYSSLSHFGKAFTEYFGTCPCLFPLRARRR